MNRRQGTLSVDGLMESRHTPRSGPFINVHHPFSSLVVASLHIQPYFILSLFISLTFSNINAQENLHVYIPPIDIPLVPSGNFGELRSNHFHTGLDFKTEGRIGIPIKAIADGWVSRIKVSPYGYGKALYLDHPDGHTSVYGHLDAYQGAIAERILAEQYKAKDFSVDVYLPTGEIPVKQGEVVALSGNTGGSTAPHLHFEIRRSSDQHALDPEAFGIKMMDSTKPQIIGVRLYALNDTSAVAPYPGNAKGHPAQNGNGRYSLKPGVSPEGYGVVGFALHVRDKYDNSHNSCGIRKIEMYVDDQLSSTLLVDDVDFSTTRYVNALMDFGLYKGNRMNYYRLYKLPNNKLQMYTPASGAGQVVFTAGTHRKIRFVATDASGNMSELDMTVTGATAKQAAVWRNSKEEGQLFRYDVDNHFDEPGIRFTIPAGSLYENTWVTYASMPATAGVLSPWHAMHKDLAPIQSKCTIALELTKPLPKHVWSKALLVERDGKGRISAVGGHYANGWVTDRVRSFGTYGVMVDSLAPKVMPLDIREDMKGKTSFSIRVDDDLSGIDSWTATLNDKWILLEYEPKTRTLTHTFDAKSAGQGSMDLIVEVKDERGNVGVLARRFER